MSQAGLSIKSIKASFPERTLKSCQKSKHKKIAVPVGKYNSYIFLKLFTKALSVWWHFLESIMTLESRILYKILIMALFESSTQLLGI